MFKGLKAYIFILSSLIVVGVSAQTYELKLVDILHANTGNSTNQPESAFIQQDTGSVLFSVRMNENCPSYYNFNYSFSDFKNKIALQAGDTVTRQFDFEIKALGNSCYEFSNKNFRNPFVSIVAGNEVPYSGLISKRKAEGAWLYGSSSPFFKISTPYLYAYNYPPGVNAGKLSGFLKIAVPHNYDEKKYTYFQVKLSGTSPLACSDCNFYYEIFFVFEISKTTSTDPCAIKQPDCSCCPGTIPVWNFKTNAGECICPEGTRWDKLQGKCVVEN